MSAIHANLTAASDITAARRLVGQDDLWAYGSQQKAKFDITEALALEMLQQPNPNRKANSDVLRPSYNATQFLRRTKRTWVIDFGVEKNEVAAACYEKPFEFCREHILPKRKNHREDVQRKWWWLHARPSPKYRNFALRDRLLLVTPAVSKHRVFALIDTVAVPDHALITFGDSTSCCFGILQSRIHEVWARAQATQVRERESGLRYTPQVCFETFPFPEPTEQQKIDIAAAAKELNELRENWLNPPEWTTTRVFEFPGSTDGPWSRYVTEANERGIGTVRYPRVEPRDEECVKRLAKRTLTNLYNEHPAWLVHAHARLDTAVAAAYGFIAELPNEQILEKLLALNLAHAAAEKKSAAVRKKRTSRARTIEEMI